MAHASERGCSGIGTDVGGGSRRINAACVRQGSQGSATPSGVPSRGSLPLGQRCSQCPSAPATSMGAPPPRAGARSPRT
eukprot:CAMPEP_0119417264 /NCGR_PEP_ID=MMETSP1335-20130426/15326_1 /TAXON_ID=259385 /ORGANISM="Chrysoculter rhomboideus, Strain RCC1486" /LENGTH=78 /DNA_ID=CAMNT_0007442431 /DNA_START=63 /DNA_END=295 /DNA_ORIENTATION=-